MEHCNGCNNEVNDPIRLDSHCNLPYCKDCVIKLENAGNEGMMYSDTFENQEKDRKCDRCKKSLESSFLVKHHGKYNYDCVFCGPCIEYFRKLIQDLKSI